MTDTQQQPSTLRTPILSPREKRLLRRFAQGETDKTIAQEVAARPSRSQRRARCSPTSLYLLAREPRVAGQPACSLAFADQEIIVRQLRRAAGSF